jgi:hypothetical protein
MCLWRAECRRCVTFAISPQSKSRLTGRCGIHKISKPYRPPRPVTDLRAGLDTEEYLDSCQLVSLHRRSCPLVCYRVNGTARDEVWYRDSLCGLVVRVHGCRPRGPGFDSRRYQIFWVAMGLERGPLSLFSINEELLERKNSGSGLEIWE